MSESFVDLSYRGLSLGRRIKLTRVEAAAGYLETPAPMPVGTAIVIAIEDGLTLDAVVMQVHEQVGGTTTPPGMLVTPRLEGEAINAWWGERVAAEKLAAAASAEVAAEPVASFAPSSPPPAAPAAPAVAARPERLTVRPRSHTVPAPPPEGAIADAAEWQSDLGMAAAALAAAISPAPAHEAGGATTVMAAVDPSIVEAASRDSGQMDISVPHAIVDDGQKTTVMDAVDPAALGLEMTASGRFVAVSPPEDTDVGEASTSDDKKPGSGKKKRKRKG